jgi:hypothetical protein
MLLPEACSGRKKQSDIVLVFVGLVVCCRNSAALGPAYKTAGTAL